MHLLGSYQAPTKKKLTFICLVTFFWGNGAAMLKIVGSFPEKISFGTKLELPFFFLAQARPEPIDIQNFAPGPGPVHGPPVAQRASPARGEHWPRVSK